MDVVDSRTRSKMMSGIRSRNTRPEMRVRSGLHRRGFRFRVNRKDLPGTPDVVLPKHNVLIYVHGCFWHGHGCHLFKWPQTRPEFWRAKIEANKSRDVRTLDSAREQGWRVAVIWECGIKGKTQLENIEEFLDLVAHWITTEEGDFVSFGAGNGRDAGRYGQASGTNLVAAERPAEEYGSQDQDIVP